MPLCTLFAAAALWAGAADVTDVDVVNVRPSKIVEKIKSIEGPKEAVVEALDESGKIRIHADRDLAQQLKTYIGMFDVKPMHARFTVHVESKLDRTDYGVDVDVPNNESYEFSETATGTHLGLTPRINGDGTVTVYLSYRRSGREVKTVFRLKHGEKLAYSDGPHGSFAVFGAEPKHKETLDPVFVISAEPIDR